MFAMPFRDDLVFISPVNSPKRDIEMTRPGSLRHGMPVLAGSNFSGVVIALGNECCKLRTGDYVYGLCRIGRNRYSPFQETFLVDEDLAFKKPDRISPKVAASIGIGVVVSDILLAETRRKSYSNPSSQVAALGVVMGGRMEVPKYGTPAERRDEWVVILGGNGAVGKFAIQVRILPSPSC
jgi:NADPH:quinone reductase-like Zn-dependent oxidoreductase